MSIRGNSSVIRFINQFKTLFKELTIEETDTIEKVFRNGYCYYFAIMLKDAFNRGEVCMTYDCKHVVWIDDDNVAYDINGIFGWYTDTSNKDNYWNGLLVPVEKIPNYIESFKHIPDKPGTDRAGMEEFDNVKKDMENKKDFMNVKIWSFDDPLNIHKFSNVDDMVNMILTHEPSNGFYYVAEKKVIVNQYMPAPDEVHMLIYGLRYDNDTKSFYGNIRMRDTTIGKALRKIFMWSPESIRIFPKMFGTTGNGVFYHVYQFISFAYEIIDKPKKAKDEETNPYEEFIKEISEEPIAEMREVKEGLLFDKDESPIKRFLKSIEVSLIRRKTNEIRRSCCYQV